MLLSHCCRAMPRAACAKDDSTVCHAECCQSHECCWVAPSCQLAREATLLREAQRCHDNPFPIRKACGLTPARSVKATLSERGRPRSEGASASERAGEGKRGREREREPDREREVPALGGDDAPAPKPLVTDACDCNEGGVDTWSPEKKAWCCTHYKNGCPTYAPPPTPGGGCGPTSPLFNCKAGLFNWQAGWSLPKKDWCCKHFGKGCAAAGGGCAPALAPYAPAPYAIVYDAYAL